MGKMENIRITFKAETEDMLREVLVYLGRASKNKDVYTVHDKDGYMWEFHPTRTLDLTQRAYAVSIECNDVPIVIVWLKYQDDNMRWERLANLKAAAYGHALVYSTKYGMDTMVGIRLKDPHGTKPMEITLSDQDDE